MSVAVSYPSLSTDLRQQHIINRPMISGQNGPVARGKWAQGIVPRNFRWVIKDQLAVCERPGGYGENHRRVRREEEIIWVKHQGFTCVISLIASPHNLHNYEEHELTFQHRPLPLHPGDAEYLHGLFGEVKALTSVGGKVLIHRDELGEEISGLVAGYLLWDSLVPSGPKAISVAERLLEHQLGPRAREIVAAAEQLGPGG